MRFTIGAMSVGDILDRGIKMLTSRLLTFYVINLVVIAPIFVLQVAFPALGGGGFELDANGQLPPGQLLAFIGGLYGVLFLNLILQQIGTAATLHVISQEFVDRHVGIGGAMLFALGRFGSLLWASLLVGLMSTLGAFMCCFPFFLFMVWNIFASQVVVVEQHRGVNALSRSMRLTSGYRWRIFAVMVLFAILYIINAIVDSMIRSAFPSATPVRTETAIIMVTNYRNYILNLTITYLGQILVQTYAAICWTLLYFDIRIRKEGLDLELAVQQQSGDMGLKGKPYLDISYFE